VNISGTPYANLMQGYLVDRGTSDLDLAFGGLAAGQEYGFYIYTQGDDNSKNRSIGISANNGAQLSSTQSNIGTFIEGDNYLYIVATANSQGVVDLKGQELNGEGNINGVQLLAAPEPSSIVLLMAGLVFVAGAAVRSKARAR
jgi:predicted extracellular nuclease